MDRRRDGGHRVLGEGVGRGVDDHRGVVSTQGRRVGRGADRRLPLDVHAGGLERGLDVLPLARLALEDQHQGTSEHPDRRLSHVVLGVRVRLRRELGPDLVQADRQSRHLEDLGRAPRRKHHVAGRELRSVDDDRELSLRSARGAEIYGDVCDLPLPQGRGDVDAADQRLRRRRPADRQYVDANALRAKGRDRAGRIVEVLLSVGDEHKLTRVAVRDQARGQPQGTGDVGVGRVRLGLEGVELWVLGQGQLDRAVVAEGDHPEQVVRTLRRLERADGRGLRIQAAA